MVSFIGELQHVDVGVDSITYDVTKCFVIPIQFLYFHYLMDNLNFKMKPEEMRASDKVTTRFCGEVLGDFMFAKRKYTVPSVQWAIYSTIDRQWYSIKETATRKVYFICGSERKVLPGYNYYYLSDDGIRCDGSPGSEYRYNQLISDFCGKYVPFSLKSRAPIFGETEAVFD